MAISITDVAAFPMGPKMRAFFGISPEEYRGDSAPAPDAEAQARFETAVAERAAATPPTSEEDLVDLIDELVAMNVPSAALTLQSLGESLWTGTNFRGELALGVAAMLNYDFSLAETSFRRAQELMPSEPAPYVNMALIALSTRDMESAREWAEAGLEVEPNNYRLWDVYAESVIDEHGEDGAAPVIRETATRTDSWAGWSLAADLEARGDVNLKAQYLKPFYDKGLREGEYLVEYTAALGMAGDFDAIPQIVWDAERALGRANVPWQLLMHAAQAHLAQSRIQDGLQVLDHAERHPKLSDKARAVLQSLREEARHSEPAEETKELH